MTAISEDFSMPNIQLKQLPSPLERAGITLTAISIATLATHFFSTYIPITPIQNFVRNIHKIPYMPPVITILSSTLGAIGIAGIIKSYISKPPTKEQTNFLSPDSSEEAIRQDLIAIFSNKRDAARPRCGRCRCGRGPATRAADRAAARVHHDGGWSRPVPRPRSGAPRRTGCVEAARRRSRARSSAEPAGTGIAGIPFDLRQLAEPDERQREEKSCTRHRSLRRPPGWGMRSATIR